MYTLLGNHHHHPSLEPFLPGKTEILFPLKNSSFPPPLAPQLLAPTTLSVLPASVTLTVLSPHESGISQYLSFCVWLMSPVGCSPWGRKESETTERLHFHSSLSCIGEGNGNYSSVLAWRIPGTGEPGGLPSLGSHRVGHA